MGRSVNVLKEKDNLKASTFFSQNIVWRYQVIAQELYKNEITCRKRYRVCNQVIKLSREIRKQNHARGAKEWCHLTPIILIDAQGNVSVSCPLQVGHLFYLFAMDCTYFETLHFLLTTRNNYNVVISFSLLFQIMLRTVLNTHLMRKVDGKRKHSIRTRICENRWNVWSLQNIMKYHSETCEDRLLNWWYLLQLSTQRFSNLPNTLFLR